MYKDLYKGDCDAFISSQLYILRISGEGVHAEDKVNATNSKGCTALHYACWNGYLKVAEALKTAGADLNVKYVWFKCTKPFLSFLSIFRCTNCKVHGSIRYS